LGVSGALLTPAVLATLATAGLMALDFGFARAEPDGCDALITLGPLAAGASALVAFVWVQARVKGPLLPLQQHGAGMAAARRFGHTPTETLRPRLQRGQPRRGRVPVPGRTRGLLRHWSAQTSALNNSDETPIGRAPAPP
ncbi:hypothetical protein JYK22_04040, partial [Nonomuraea sp. RK-328]|nr:hypothetical protein [Nonomuraea sp. RK-328]